jgi:hypothetical protein
MRVPPNKNVESIDHKVNQELLKRRSFMKFAGAATASTALLFSGCKDILKELPVDVDIDPDDYVTQTIYLGKGDTGVLNYAYALEQLEAEFYLMVAANPKFSSIFSKEEQLILMDIKYHEVAHRDFLKAALGAKAIKTLKFDFSAVKFDEKQSVLQTAKTFEDLGVAAYNGAGRLLTSKDLLTVAGKIVSVEARHAAAIRRLVDMDPTSFAGDDVIDMNGLDRAFMPSKVLMAADPFIVNKIDASEL